MTRTLGFAFILSAQALVGCGPLADPTPKPTASDLAVIQVDVKGKPWEPPEKSATDLWREEMAALDVAPECRWEYLLDLLPPRSLRLAERLEMRGRQGWELISVEGRLYADHQGLLFKRRVGLRRCEP